MVKKKKHGKSRGFNKSVLINSIKGLFKNEPDMALNYRQISKTLDIKTDGERKLVYESLCDLREDGFLTELTSGKFILISGNKIKSGRRDNKRDTERSGRRTPEGNQITGVVDMTSRGTAYIVSDEMEEDVFIAFANTNHALNKDKVRVVVYAKNEKKQAEGEIIEILERYKETFVGTLDISPNFAFLISDSKRMPFDIFIPKNKLGGGENGDKVVVKMGEWPRKQKNPFGEVITVLGRPGDNETEMHAILAEYELPYEFSDEVLKAAEAIPDTISSEEIAKRRDFRGITTFTIDPHDAKDFDDALSIQQLPNGNWEIGVHIADVSHYITPGSLLDREAYARATSVYLVDRVVAMLPERISNGICSLRPNEEKLTFSTVFEIDENAKVVNHWIGRTVIESDRRYSYEEAQEIIEGAEGDYSQEIHTLDDLAQILRKDRYKHGAIDFDREEVKFEIDENGKPLSVYFKRAKEANKLIEEFMLLANKYVAASIGKVGENKKAKTFVYRIHDVPNPEKLDNFNRFIARFGYSIKTDTRKEVTTSLNAVLAEVKEKPEANLLETLAVRTMAKAQYSTENIGHYGLSFDYYSHFTSPIRRYPDMMVHRLIQYYLDKGNSVDQAEYEEMCKHCSDQEGVAANAERSSIKYKQVEFMSDKIGEDFWGTISGVTEWGIYVELDDNKCEGMVSIANLEDDYYEFDEKNYAIVGRKHRKTYQLGEHVRVKLSKANLVAKQIDFEML
jgi:ribonuclease R